MLLRRMARLLGLLVLGYVGLCVVGKLFYRRMLYPAPTAAVATRPPAAELLNLRASDGIPVRALYFANHRAVRTIVVFHGNGSTMDDEIPLATDLVRRGFACALLEYRGYGPNASGSPSEEGLYLDAEALLGQLREWGVGSERVVLWGTSLGSGVAAEMAHRKHGAALVLVTPYTSISEMARGIASFLPTDLWVTDRFDTLEKAKSIDVPTLVIHGDQDEVIPFEMGQRVSRAIPGARFIEVRGGHHNDLFAREGERLMTEIDAHSRAPITASSTVQPPIRH